MPSAGDATILLQKTIRQLDGLADRDFGDYEKFIKEAASGGEQQYMRRRRGALAAKWAKLIKLVDDARRLSKEIDDGVW
jgi:hypothetical protein